jgi:hypothetical protein
MMRTLAARLSFALLFAVLFAVTATLAISQTATAADPLAPVAWLVGGTWKAEVPNPNGGAARKIEQRMERTLGGKAVRFVTKFDGVVEYEGFFAYDAAKKQVVFAYPSASGDVTTGIVAAAPEGLLMDFTISDAQATATHYQVHVKKSGPDDYTWALFASADGGWSPLFQVKYHRES